MLPRLVGLGIYPRGMPEIRRSGRTEHELVEVAPETLDCGHPSDGNVESVSFAAETVNGERMRTYRCRRCGAVTFSPELG